MPPCTARIYICRSIEIKNQLTLIKRVQLLHMHAQVLTLHVAAVEARGMRLRTINETLKLGD